MFPGIDKKKAGAQAPAFVFQVRFFQVRCPARLAASAHMAALGPSAFDGGSTEHSAVMGSYPFSIINLT